MFFLKMFYALFFLASGIATIKYRKNIYEWTGRFAWAEHYLGNGGTVIIITLTGMFLIFLSIAYPSGAFERDKNSEGLLKGWDNTQQTNTSTDNNSDGQK